jgi:hypothetical protein
LDGTGFDDVNDFECCPFQQVFKAFSSIHFTLIINNKKLIESSKSSGECPKETYHLETTSMNKIQAKYKEETMDPLV